jgi:4-carboxymuconolactone decarboxylase
VLDPARAALVRLSAALATRQSPVIRAAMRDAARVADPGAVDEVLLQSHLFIGFPDALNAISLWREVSGTAAPAPSGEDPAGWPARGERVCAAVYAGSYPRLRENIGAMHPDMDDWMATGGYGRVIGRPGLDLPTRELCIAALLAVWNVPRQLHSHLRGALNAGAAPEAVAAAVEIAAGLIPAERAEAVRGLWRQVRGAAAATTSER